MENANATHSANWPQPDNINAIRASFDALQLSEREAGLVFYQRLFEVAPAVRHLFPASLDEQAEKLFKTLRLLVASLDRLDTILPILRDLGRRHTQYGAKPDHYLAVGSALMWTLREALGEALTHDAEQDWLRLFNLAAQEMIQGAEAASGD